MKGNIENKKREVKGWKEWKMKGWKSWKKKV